MPKESALSKIIQGTDSAVGLCCKFFLVLSGSALLLILMVNVIFRMVGYVGFSSAEELPSLIFPVFSMAGVVMAAKNGTHVATQILINTLTGVWKKMLSLLIHALTAAAYLVLAIYAFDNALIAHDELSIVLGVPKSVGFGSLAAGMFLVALCSILMIIRQVTGMEVMPANPVEE